MDGSAFDRIARLWGTTSHRRRLLRLIGASAITGSWFSRAKTVAAQMGAEQMTCVQDADCGDGDADPCTGAACIDGFCTFFIVDCIPGTICCGNGECCPIGGIGRCTTDADCGQISLDPCQRAICAAGTCLSQRMPCPPGEFCHLGSCTPIGSA
jgi:hypothetical protein